MEANLPGIYREFPVNPGKCWQGPAGIATMTGLQPVMAVMPSY